MNVRTTSLKDSVEQNRKRLFEMINKTKNKNKNIIVIEESKDKTNNNENNNKKEIKNNNKINDKKEIKEINKKENINNKKENNDNDEKNKNNKKYGEKINAKKKLLSNNMHSKLYKNDNKKEKDKDKDKDKEKEKEKEKTKKINIKKNNIKDKNNKLNKNNQNNSSYKASKKNIESIVIDEDESEENDKLNNTQHFPMINELKKELISNPRNAHKKQNTNQNLTKSSSFIKKYLTESNLNKSKKIEKGKKQILIDDTHLFKPEINQKSKNLIKQKKKKSSPVNKKENGDNTYIENRRLNTKAPIVDLLYEDAFNKKQKLENSSENEIINMKKYGYRRQISRGSIHLLSKKNKTKLSEIFEKYSKDNDGKISIINVIQCLYEMHILRYILKFSTHSIEEINLEHIKIIVEDIINKKAKNPREVEEIEFMEQFWIKINPSYESEKDYAEKDIVYNFLKVLFSLDEQTEINRMIKIVDNYLKTINKNNQKEDKEINNINNENNDNDNDDKEKKEDNEKKEDKENIENDEKNENKENDEDNENKDNNNKKLKFNSLLRDKEYTKNEIWPLSKFIKVFFKLKLLLSEYQISSKKEEIKEKIIKEREKELTFQPDFNATASYFRRQSKQEKNEDSSNISLNTTMTNISRASNKKKSNFNKLYEEFMLKKQMHEKALMILRENKEKREIKMCTYRPKINKDYKFKNRGKTPEMGCSRNEFLYNLNKDLINKKKEKIKESENEFKSRFSFRPKITTNEDLMNKSFIEGEKKMPKGSEAYIKRNRSVIELRKAEKNNQKEKVYGENYEKIRKQKVMLPRIKDLEPWTNLLQQTENEKKDNKNENENDNNNNTDNDNDNDIFFNIQVRTANGRIRHLKIYINKNPIETVNNFCDTNNIKKGTREKIIKKVNELKDIYQKIGDKEEQK